MPLIKSTSKQAFGKNIAAERAAGRPIKQAVAIAYSEKRAAARSEHHSSHSAQRSRDYHRAVAGTQVRPSSTRMTRGQNQINNNED